MRRAGWPAPPASAPATSFSKRAFVSPQQLLADVKAGFYVTELMGFGVNMVTGDYSRGAAGLWIENGELTFAVEESHHRRQPEGDAQQHRRHRRRPGISRLGCLPHLAHRRNDHRRGIALTAGPSTSLRSGRDDTSLGTRKLVSVTEVSSRPERSEVEGPAVASGVNTAIKAQHANQHRRRYSVFGNL